MKKRDALLSFHLLHLFFDESLGEIETYGWNDTTFIYETADGHFAYDPESAKSSKLPILSAYSVFNDLNRGEVKRCDSGTFERLDNFPWIKNWRYNCFQVSQNGTQILTTPFYPKQLPDVPNVIIIKDDKTIPISGRLCLIGPPMISEDGNYIAIFATELNASECASNFADIHILHLR